MAEIITTANCLHENDPTAERTAVQLITSTGLRYDHCRGHLAPAGGMALCASVERSAAVCRLPLAPNRSRC